MLKDLGEVEQALECFLEALRSVDNSNIRFLAWTYNNIGEIYHQQDNLGKALEYQQKSLGLKKQLGNDLEIADTLFDLIWLYIDWEGREIAQKFFNELKKISQLYEGNPVIHQQCLLASALILKHNKRYKDKFEALDIFRKVASEPVVKHKLTSLALLNYCDLLIFELLISEVDEVIDEIKKATRLLEQIARKQHSHSLSIELLLLQAKLTLLETKNLDETRKLLLSAQQQAQQKGLRKLAITIARELDALLDQDHPLKSLDANDFSIKNKLEIIRLEELVKQISTKRLVITQDDIIPEEPVMLLIMNKGLFFPQFNHLAKKSS